jgi:hypothetical protein
MPLSSRERWKDKKAVLESYRQGDHAVDNDIRLLWVRYGRRRASTLEQDHIHRDRPVGGVPESLGHSLAVKGKVSELP